MHSRQWQIVFHLHADRSATARIHVDGRLLLPECDGLPVGEALGYVAAALIDSHPADRLLLRTQGSAGAIRSARYTDATQAQDWLRQRCAELGHALEPTLGDAASDEGARSGVRAALRGEADRDQAEARPGRSAR
jgi:hypothetical protein